MIKPLALVIEDGYELSHLLARITEMAGYEAEVIHSGDIALDRLAEVIPDLVLLDLNLPKILGSNILLYIRSEPRLRKVYVIVVTAFQHLAESIYDQADHVLNKPFDLDELDRLLIRT